MVRFEEKYFKVCFISQSFIKIMRQNFSIYGLKLSIFGKNLNEKV
jgi:hypothetical protein